MNIRSRTLALVVSVLIRATTGTAGSLPDVNGRGDRPKENFRTRRIAFEANRGQTDPAVRFLARSDGSVLYLTAREAVWRLAPSGKHEQLGRSTGRFQNAGSAPAVFRVSFEGQAPAIEPEGEDLLPEVSHYLIGKDPAKWHRNVPSFAKVRYRNVRPGVDLVFHGNAGRPEFDFIVAPGADPSRIQFSLPGTDKATIDARGDLLLASPGGERRLARPGIYQETPSGRASVRGRYVLSHRRGSAPLTVRFRVGPHDPTRALVIDPVLLHSTYLGGTSDDGVAGIALDRAGNAFVTGETTSIDFPGTANSPLQKELDGEVDAFLTKVSASGSAILYSTYLGGSQRDSATAIAVDSSGNAYLTGFTNSTDFPGTSASAIQPANAGDYDGFLAKIDPTGSSIVFATYLGTAGFEQAHGIALDSDRNVYVIGEGDSPGFPGTASSPVQSSFGGVFDVFVTKIDAAAAAIVYSTYLGGTGADYGAAIAIDASGNASVAGQTNSPNFPGTASSIIQPALAGGFDGFAARIDAAGTSIVYATYLGGNLDDSVSAIAVDASGNAYAAGETFSTGFPGTSSSLVQPVFGGAADGFLAKIDPAGGSLVYATYLGGSQGDFATGVAVDGSGTAYVTGRTDSPDFPGAGGSTIQPVFSEGGDAFVTVIDPAGASQLFSTYLGGAHDDFGVGIAVDAFGNILATGGTNSEDFPGAAGSPIQPALAVEGGLDAFLVKISAVARGAQRSRAIPVPAPAPIVVSPR